MNAAINTFPPLHSFSTRNWVLIVIVALHLGFFWALTAGLSVRALIPLPKPPPVLVPIPPTPPVPTVKPTIVDPSQLRQSVAQIPLPTRTFETPDEQTALRETETVTGPTEIAKPAVRAPVVVSPTVDPAVGLSEPPYPAQEIRLQHTGTVLLSVQVLTNGRIGEVRIERSSGYPRLDAAAANEARRWRLRPGTQDGVPVIMWKQVPITFRLRE